MIEVYGVSDQSINSALKAWVRQDATGIGVCGLIGPGTSRTLQANWNSPFEGASVGSSFMDKVMNVGQAFTGKSSTSTFNSIQNWEGNRPLTFNLVLQFFALSDPNKEVMMPLEVLEQMASPQVNNNMTGIDVRKLNEGIGATLGQIPYTVSICIGGKMTIQNCVIENVSTPLDKERDKWGNLIRAEVNLSIQTKQMLNRSDIPGTWGHGPLTPLPSH